jgi:hypothetical protein
VNEQFAGAGFLWSAVSASVQVQARFPLECRLIRPASFEVQSKKALEQQEKDLRAGKILEEGTN